MVGVRGGRGIRSMRASRGPGYSGESLAAGEGEISRDTLRTAGPADPGL